jgi:hypothetical protein
MTTGAERKFAFASRWRHVRESHGPPRHIESCLDLARSTTVRTTTVPLSAEGRPVSPIACSFAGTAILGWVEAQISDARTDPDGLVDLAPLSLELHRHHLEVSKYRALVEDLGSSWASRLLWYRQLLANGGSYVTADDRRGRVIG